MVCCCQNPPLTSCTFPSPCPLPEYLIFLSYTCFVGHVCITYDLISLLPFISPTNAALGRYKGTVLFHRSHFFSFRISPHSGKFIIPLLPSYMTLGTCFYSMGVRVMDTSWVSRKGSSTLTRKASSTPPGTQGPGSPADTLIPEQPGELATSPSATPPLGERVW